MCIGFLVSLQHTSGSCSIICIPMGSGTTFHWAVVTHLESCGSHTSHLTTETPFDLRCESVTLESCALCLEPF